MLSLVAVRGGGQPLQLTATIDGTPGPATTPRSGSVWSRRAAVRAPGFRALPLTQVAGVGWALWPRQRPARPAPVLGVSDGPDNPPRYDIRPLISLVAAAAV